MPVSGTHDAPSVLAGMVAVDSLLSHVNTPHTRCRNALRPAAAADYRHPTAVLITRRRLCLIYYLFIYLLGWDGVRA